MTSPDAGSNAAVAPRSSASCRFAATGSTTNVCVAPAASAPNSAMSPTPPAPNTATLEPGVTRATLNTAPSPVSAAQPKNDAISSGASVGMRTTDSCAQTTRSQNALTPR